MNVFRNVCFVAGLSWSSSLVGQTVSVPYGSPHQETAYLTHVYREPGTHNLLALSILTANTPDTLEGSQSSKLWYQISNDSGVNYSPYRQLIQQGASYDIYRPIEGIDVRKVGFATSRQAPFRATNGEIMVPIELWRLDENGEAYNPAYPYTYADSAVLIGRWTPGFGDVTWNMGERLQLPLEDSTAGAYEPGLVELSTPGRFAISLRASNIFDNSIPSYKWIATSDDYTRTWSDPVPLTYTNGENFFSPSSVSEFFRHSNGNVYWIGNIIANNADGNTPRDPLIIAQFDETLLGLKKDTVHVLFTRNPAIDGPQVQFSNFTASEDPETGNIIVGLQRFDPSYSGPYPYSEAVYNVLPVLDQPGDFDSDGDVDGADFVAWQTNFPTASGATLATGDADGDGDVDGADFVVWQTNFPTTLGPSVAAVPEPSTSMLTSIALVVFGIVGRRKHNRMFATRRMVLVTR